MTAFLSDGEPKAVDQVLEARVRAKGVESRLDLQKKQSFASIFRGPLPADLVA